MKRLLVVSDSHTDIRSLARVFEASVKKYGVPDAILHCGDGCLDLSRLDETFRAVNPDVLLYAVRGNCDWDGCAEVPFERVVELEGTRIFMAHGQRYAIKSTIFVLDDAAKEAGCSIALFGHTHVPFMQMASVLMLNPGCAHLGQYLSMELRDGQPRIHLDHL